jgi:geranylgeranyl reductase family protein
MITTSLDTTVLIIGAGPAGATLAYQLNKLNIPNIIIEKEHFPRHKLCGGALTARTLELFDFDISPQIITPIDTAVLHFEDKEPISRKMDKPFVYIIDRNDFDDFLLEKATQTGTQVIHGNKWEIKDNSAIINGSEIKFKYLVGADGAYSRIRKMFNLANSNGIGLERFTPQITNDKALHVYYDETKNGYGWIFPAKNNKNTIGITRLDNTKNKIKEDYIRFQNRLNINEPIEAHVIPIFDKKNIYAKGNIALAGDAAQLCDHVLGEGIYYSIHSACILANSINESSKEEKDLEEVYHSKLAPLLKDLHNSSRIAKIIYHYPTLCYIIAKLNPQIIDIYLRQLNYQYSYTELTNILKKRLYFLRHLLFISKKRA